MASVEAVLNTCSRYFDQRPCDSDENSCENCCKMRDYLTVLTTELKSAQLIIQLLQDELKTHSDSVEKKNIHCDPTEKTHIKSKWPDIVLGWSIGRKKEEDTSKQILEPNITSTDQEWKTVSRGYKKPPTVDRASNLQIPAIINRYEQFSNSRREEKLTHSQMKTYELKTRKDSREKMRQKTNKQEKKKHKIIVIGDSHARGCAAEIKTNLDKDFDILGFVNPGAGLSTITASAELDIQQLSKQDVVIVWGGSRDVGKKKQNRA